MTPEKGTPVLNTPEPNEALRAQLVDACDRFLAKLRDDALRRLRAQASHHPVVAREAAVTAAAAGDQPQGPPAIVSDPLALFSAADWSSMVADDLEPLIGQVVVDSANRAVVGAAFDVTNPAMSRAVAKHVQQMQSWGPRLQLNVANTVQMGMDQGWSVDRMADELSTVGPLAPSRASTIAHDVAVACSNAGTIASWRTVGGVNAKQWMATEDDRTRPDHSAADGQLVPIDAQFIVGGESCDYPGDPSLSAAQSANCRCTMQCVYDDSAPAAEASVDDGSGDQSLEGDDSLISSATTPEAAMSNHASRRVGRRPTRLQTQRAGRFAGDGPAPAQGDTAPLDSAPAPAAGAGAQGGDGQPFEPAPYKADPDETIKCPSCELMNDADARFCDQCGEELEGNRYVKVEASPAAPAETAPGETEGAGPGQAAARRGEFADDDTAPPAAAGSDGSDTGDGDGSDGSDDADDSDDSGAPPDANAPSGAMIALYPDDPAGLALGASVEGATPPDELHCTVRYLGQAADLNDDQIGMLRQAVGTFAAGYTDIADGDNDVDALVEAVSLFGEDDNGDGAPDCLVLLLNGPDLAEIEDGLRDPLDDLASQVGLDFPDDHPVWVPHVTLADGATDTSVAVQYIGTNIKFSTLSLVIAGERYDYPLGEPNDDASAAGGDEDGTGDEGDTGAGGDASQTTSTKEATTMSNRRGRRASFADTTGSDSGDGAGGGTGEVYEPEPYEAQPDETVQCPACQKMNDPDAAFCDQCGLKLAGNPDVKPPEDSGDAAGGDAGTGDDGGGSGGGSGPGSTMQGAEPAFSVGEGDTWSGVLIVEGIPSGDGRQITEGALSWRELPLPLMMMTRNPEGGMGHDGAQLCGQITNIWREGNEIWGSGTFDLGCESGIEAQRLVSDKQLRGVSADLDSVQIDFENPDPWDDPDADLEDLFEWDPGMLLVTEGRIMGATLTPFPAFSEAAISIIDGDSGDEIAPAMVASAGGGNRMVKAFTPIRADASGYALVASAGAGKIPTAPPAKWFTKAKFDGPEPVRISADGRISGHAVQWESCHIGFSDRCVRPPRSTSNYAHYRTGTVITAEGNEVATGPLVMDTVHPNLRMRASDAQAFYADTGCAIGDVALYEDEWGIQVAGAARPTVSAEQLRAARGSDWSPDWRTIAGKLELCALLAVNNTGFKVPAALAASAGKPAARPTPGRTRAVMDLSTGRMSALVAAGMVRRSDRHTADLSAEVADLREQMAEMRELVRPLRLARANEIAATVTGGTRAARAANARRIIDEVRARR